MIIPAFIRAMKYKLVCKYDECCSISVVCDQNYNLK